MISFSKKRNAKVQGIIIILYDNYILDGENSTSLNMTNMISEVANRSAIICTEGYYLSSDNLCRPLCTLWVNPPGVGLDSDNIAVIVSAIIAVISSIIVIVLALTIQRSTM